MKDQLSLFPKIENTSAVGPNYATLYDELLQESVLAICAAPRFTERHELLECLRDELPQKSPNTRRINAYKIMERFFPEENIHTPLVAWWPQLDEGTRRQLLFYTIACQEPLVIDFVTQVIYPNLGHADFSVEVARAFVTLRLLRPDLKTAERLLRLLKKTGWIEVNKGRVKLLQVQPTWPAFLFALHEEFGDGKRRCLTEFNESRLRKFFLLSDAQLQSLLLRGWNQQYIIYETRRKPEGFRLKMTLSELTETKIPDTGVN